MNIYQSANFKFIFELMAENKKIFKFITKREYLSKCNVLYISMDSSWQALQTNGKLFSNFELVFELLADTEKIFNE